MKIYVGFFIVALTLGFSTADPIQEAPCAAAAGICAMKSSCPNNPYIDGLCPMQQKHGVECCYEPEERLCRSIGGECIYNCPPVITKSDIVCPSGKQCCVWLS